MELIQFIEPNFKCENENGLLVQLVRDGWKQVNVIYTPSGRTRGRHFHKCNKEAFYVISGAFKLQVWKDNKKEVYNISKGDMFVVNENVFHTFIYEEDTWLVSMYNNGVELADGEKDICD